MESWITWIIQVVAYGIICFLLKRELNQFDQRDKRLQERIDEVEKKASADTKALAEKMDNFIQEAPFKYTLRDDFIRAVAGFDAKLDKILDQLQKARWADMAANLTVAANKRVRGEILALLYSVQPVPVEIRTITNSLLESNMVSVPSIAQHIDYLSGKKYIQVIGEEAAEQILHGVVPPSAFVKLTPTGVDLVEGTIEDQGVDV